MISERLFATASMRECIPSRTLRAITSKEAKTRGSILNPRTKSMIMSIRLLQSEESNEQVQGCLLLIFLLVEIFQTHTDDDL
jgi:hypothetical protein